MESTNLLIRTVAFAFFEVRAKVRRLFLFTHLHCICIQPPTALRAVCGSGFGFRWGEGRGSLGRVSALVVRFNFKGRSVLLLRTIRCLINSRHNGRTSFTRGDDGAN